MPLKYLRKQLAALHLVSIHSGVEGVCAMPVKHVSGGGISISGLLGCVVCFLALGLLVGFGLLFLLLVVPGANTKVHLVAPGWPCAHN